MPQNVILPTDFEVDADKTHGTLRCVLQCQASLEELSRVPQSGGVFALDVGLPGLPEPMYAG